MMASSFCLGSLHLTHQRGQSARADHGSAGRYGQGPLLSALCRSSISDIGLPSVYDVYDDVDDDDDDDDPSLRV